MARRLTYAEFDASLKNLTLPKELVGDYVTMDPDAPIPRLILKPDALLDRAPPEYDVDREIYSYLRKVKQATRVALRAFSVESRTRVALEGDSWFEMPDFFRPSEIGDFLASDPALQSINVAYWGDTLSSILENAEYRRIITEENPAWILISAGGNDLRLGVAEHGYLRPYDPGLTPHQYLTPAGEKGMETIRDGYEQLLNDITSIDGNLQIVCHGYDYPRPTKKSKYIGRYMARLGIPEDKMKPITDSVLQRLNQELASAVKLFGNAHYVNCLGETDTLTWYDDMHPNSDGFKALTARLRAVIK